MIELTIVRHGQTEGNQKQMYQGWTDVPLDETGVWQAERLSMRLKDYEFDGVYSSPLSRAFETASIINRHHNLEIHKVENIKEINFGEWENMERKKLEELYPGYMEEWRKDWRKFSFRGGENLEMAYGRISSWLDGFVGNNEKGRFLVATHAGAIRIMMSRLVGAGIAGHWNFSVKNCGVTRVKILDGCPVLTLFNDTSHLK